MSAKGGKTPPASRLDTWATALRGQYQHEDNLLDKRLASLNTVQAFLCAAFAFSHGKPPGWADVVFAVLGLFVVLFSVMCTNIAKTAQKELKDVWKTMLADRNYLGPNLVGLPSRDGDRDRKHLRPWRLGLPAMFAVGWVALLGVSRWHP